MRRLRCGVCGERENFERDIDTFSSMIVCGNCNALLVTVEGLLVDGEKVSDRDDS